jgi:hypothetical protein
MTSTSGALFRKVDVGASTSLSQRLIVSSPLALLAPPACAGAHALKNVRGHEVIISEERLPRSIDLIASLPHHHWFSLPV